jgi:hypothetical protein
MSKQERFRAINGSFDHSSFVIISSFVIRHSSFSYHRVRFRNRETRDGYVNREAGLRKILAQPRPKFGARAKENAFYGGNG